MDVKKEIEDVDSVDASNEYFLQPQYSQVRVNVKLEEDSEESNNIPTENELSDHIKQEVDIEPIAILDPSAGIFMTEDQYPNIDIGFGNNSTDLNDRGSKCNICNRKFNYKSSLENHLISHTKERPFECDICHGTFKRKGDLKKHLVKHSDKYNFECSICHNKYKWKSNLNMHLMTHSYRYNFECVICHGKFKRKDELKKHLVKHSDKYNFECGLCHKKFKRKQELNRHLVKHSD